MKTQISRNSNRPLQRYSGVYQQQGRMITDADWNELGDLDKQRLWSALVDVLRSGAPRGSGLRVNGDKTLQPGWLYVDGIPAQLPGAAPVAFTAQPDYPEAPALPAGDYTLYADVWDRTVTALEDTGLVDAGLHGADTCTRTQTMLQVKYCATALDPENGSTNPPLGNADLKLKLRQILAGGDACDPCSSEVDVNERAGNYLFRVEVHDVYSQSGSNFLVLKWSRDNGAEQYKVDNVPLDFQQGDWIYEFYDNTTEKNLGVHLAAGFSPKRGKLVDGYTVPTLAAEPKTFVRQWDGYCTLNLTTAALVIGKDKGVVFSTANSAEAQGRVTLTAASFKVNLDLLELELSLAGKVFVAGDYWQGAVREALHHSGDYILGSLSAGALPAGVRHHYLRLAGVNGAGAVIPQTDAEKRRFNFPPLTDIKATDVGFTESCHTLFNGAQNVQQALDALCTLAADDVAYTLPGCPAPSVAALLASTAGWPDLDSDGKITVKDMLDALLCRLNAGYLPYNGAAQTGRWTSIKSEAGSPVPPSTVQQALDDLVQYLDSKDVPHTVANCGTATAPSVRSLLNVPAGAATVAQILDQLLCTLNADHIPLVKPLPSCTDLNAPTVLTVQDALEVLCQKQSSGGCADTVGQGGHYASLAEAFAAYMVPGAPQDVVLCLLPGDHLLPADIAVTGKRAIKICGAGVSASVVRFQGALWRLQGQEIRLTDLAAVFSQESGRIQLESPNVTTCGCVFRRVGKAKGGLPLITVKTTSSGGTVRFSDNTLQSSWQSLSGGVKTGELISAAAGNAIIQNGLTKLVSQDVLTMSSAEVDALINGVAKEIVNAPAQTRTALSDSTKKIFAAKTTTTIPIKSKSKTKAKSKSPAPAAVSATNTLLFAKAGSSSNVVGLGGIANSGSSLSFSDALSQSNLTEGKVQAALGNLIFQIWETGYSPALALWSPKVGGVLLGNEILGEVLIMKEGATEKDLGVHDSVKAIIGNPVNAIGAKLDLIGNQIVRFSACAQINDFDADDHVSFGGPIPCYAVLNVSQNLFIEDETMLFAGVVCLQGNNFAARPDWEVATVLTNQFTAMGNTAPQGIGLRYHTSQVANAANLMGITPFT